MKIFKYDTEARPIGKYKRINLEGIIKGKDKIEAHINIYHELLMKGYDYIKTPIQLTEIGVTENE